MNWKQQLLDNPPRSARAFTKDEWTQIVMSELLEDPTKPKAKWGFGSKHTEESKALIRKNGTGIKKRPLTDAEKEVQRNRVITLEWRANISEGLKRGKKRGPFKHKVERSAEHCAKIAANKRAYWAAKRSLNNAS